MEQTASEAAGATEADTALAANAKPTATIVQNKKASHGALPVAYHASQTFNSTQAITITRTDRSKRTGFAKTSD